MKRKNTVKKSTMNFSDEDTPSLQYVSVLESILAKNSLYFLVFDKEGAILYQNLPNAHKVASIDDVSYIINEENLTKVKQMIALSFDDIFDITFYDSFLEFQLYTLRKFPDLFVLQMRAGEPTFESQQEENPPSDQHKRNHHEMQTLQAVQSLLEELRLVDTSIQSSDSYAVITNYFIPKVAEFVEEVQEPVVRLCLLTIQGSLEEYSNSNSEYSQLYSVLTPSEIKVADFIRMGMSSKDIASTLDIAQKTVDNHRNSLREKLGLKNKGINLQTYLMNRAIDTNPPPKLPWKKEDKKK